jgi:hypothetical protein
MSTTRRLANIAYILNAIAVARLQSGYNEGRLADDDANVGHCRVHDREKGKKDKGVMVISSLLSIAEAVLPNEVSK